MPEDDIVSAVELRADFERLGIARLGRRERVFLVLLRLLSKSQQTEVVSFMDELTEDYGHA